jgi:octaheme c-type cytochrome (tetrathionate reductase family)
VDCLVCHEQTGTYEKFPSGAGHPAQTPTKFGKKMFLPPDWNKVAQSVARPSRANCGVCHFYGGGGDGVKHGDLDSSLFKPNKKLDVHMGVDGQNFTCTRCHSTELHKIAGRVYSTPAAKHRKSLIEDDLSAKIMCESCHSTTPHKKGTKPNDHTDKVACQSCHIPAFARVNPTKMVWDWTSAGKMKDGKPYTVKGPYGKDIYNTKKGTFVWEKDVIPEYHWYNGAMQIRSAEETVDPSGVVRLTWPMGNKDMENARIFPFKVHHGKTAYDAINNNVVIPKLFGKKGSDAYWQKYDWNKAITAGMEYVGLPYSGEYGFLDSVYAFPISHMVAPKSDSVACVECHTRNGRLDNLTGFYMPGRDRVTALDMGGWTLVAASLIGVAIHALARIFSFRLRKKEE